MPRKNTVNFAQTIITAPSSGITTLVGTAGTSDTFPATNFYATIQQVVAGEIIKKEVVLCSTRTGTTFSVTRGQDGTTAQDFTTGGGVVYLVIATASAHIQDIRDKLDTVDIDIDTAEAKPATGKTTPVDADSMRLRDSAASNIKKFVTWANIKATLKTYFDTLYHTKNALRTGLTASKMLVTDGSGNEGYADLPSSVVKLAGENITQGNALRLGLGVFAGDSISQLSVNGNSVDLGYNSTNYGGGQSIVLSNGGILNSIANISLRKVGTPTGQIKLSIYDSTGATLLFTSSNSISEASITGTFTDYTFDFNNFLPAGTYRILARADRAVSATNYSQLQLHSSNLYGTRYVVSSSIVWTATWGAFRFTATVNPLNEPVTSVFRALATWTHYSNLFGFANNTSTTGNNVTIDQTYNNKKTGLTANTTYYLSNTPGEISTTAGTVSRVVGRSISTTELLINLFG